MDHAAATWASLQAIRAQAPLIHNITNFVAMDTSANCLLALGASPAMVHAEEEVEDFAALAQALVVNIGTLSPAWVRAMRLAAEAMRAERKPWVLDPVGAGATPYRRRTALQLAELGPSVIRGNASEVLTLAGAAGRPSKGVGWNGHKAATPSSDRSRGEGPPNGLPPPSCRRLRPPH